MHLITGSAGYVGNIITEKLLEQGKEVIGVDISRTDTKSQKNFISLVQDITDYEALEKIFIENKNIKHIYHCAAQLTFKRKNAQYFKKVNIEATEVLINLAIKYKVKNFIYISSNCVYGKVNSLNIKENHLLDPFEEYGISKLRSEEILLSKKNSLNVVILRAPTIIGEGRLGILSTVFDFIKENKKLYLVGPGRNRYQFVYGNDLANACVAASTYDKSNIFNIGTIDPHSLRETFEYLIEKSNSKSNIYTLPASIIIPLMKFFFKIGLSPLGPYQYNMIMNTYSGDVRLIEQELNWKPTKNNNEILYTAYKYYIDNYDMIHSNPSLVGHRKIGKDGIIKLLKWLS